MKNDVKIEDEKFLNMNELKANLDYNVLKDDMSYISANQSNEIISEKDEERKTEEGIDEINEEALTNSSFDSNNFFDDNNESDEEINIEISIQSLINKEFKDRKVLKEEMKQWAAQEIMKFNFKTSETFKKKNDIYVSTLFCSKHESKNCQFYLEFQKKKDKQYSLTKYFNSHNHDLESYSSSNEITEEIIQHIIKLQPIHNNTPAITRIINKVYKKKF